MGERDRDKEKRREEKRREEIIPTEPSTNL
jgi:hypothetical protein